MLKVRDVMTKKPITLRQNDTLKDALKVLSKNRITGCPVVDTKNKLVGVVGQTDIIKLVDVYGKINKGKEFTAFISSFIKGKALDIKKIHNIPVKNFCNKKPITIDHDSRLYEAARIMNKHDVERLPVLKDKKLVGIVSRSDIIKTLDKID
ncbi:MAG: CBS domain-containing protein [Candidatus Aenigmarchaeota archaeon]|nr:CBS domain-containing protein [Candidatus Aenigmarchaeota archaeon]